MFRIPVVTRNLLIINFLAFIAMLVFRQMNIVDLNSLCGLHFFMAQDFHVFQLVTYMFMHGGWEHIILNMFMLWMFGAVMERVWGPKRFIFYYIFCGIGAGIMQEIAQFFYIWLFGFNQSISFTEIFSVMHQFAVQLNGLTTVGASGAIYSLLLAFGMMFPDEKMFIIPIPVPIKAKWMVLGSIAIELFSALATPGDQVAHIAHLGGMIFGFFLIRYWQKHPYGGYGMQGGMQFFNSMKNKWEQKRGSHRRNDRWQGNDDRWQDHNADWDYNARQQASQEEIDRILDKIRKSGYDSLTKEEKQTLFDQGKK